MAQMNLFTKQQQTHRDQTCGCQRDWGWGTGMDWECGVGRYKPLFFECVNNRVLMYSTRIIFNTL